jgi:hypothetical protein
LKQYELLHYYDNDYIIEDTLRHITEQGGDIRELQSGFLRHGTRDSLSDIPGDHGVNEGHEESDILCAVGEGEEELTIQALSRNAMIVSDIVRPSTS